MKQNLQIGQREKKEKWSRNPGGGRKRKFLTGMARWKEGCLESKSQNNCWKILSVFINTCQNLLT
jgi:hypothetical protein